MIEVHGYSDDGIYLFGDGPMDRESVDTCARDDAHGKVTIGDKTGGCIVRAIYVLGADSDGVWAMCVEQITEETPIPWKIEIVAPCKLTPYSTCCRVHCPPDTPIKLEVADTRTGEL